MSDPTNSPAEKEWFETKPYYIRSKDEELIKIDELLTEKFTDTGTVFGATVPFIFGAELNHFSFAETGKLHTIHVSGNEASTEDAGVYVPAGFTSFQITSTDTVVATNPKTKEQILVAHVRVGNAADGKLKENTKTVRENGTIYIGQIGGKGGEGVDTQGGRGKHSHLTFFPSEKARIAATNSKSKRQQEHAISDYIVSDSPNLGDFRTLVNA